MKHCVKFVMVLIALAFAVNAQAASPNYISVSLGAYYPQSDDLTSDGADFDAGFNGGLAFGHYFMPNLAGELGVSWFRTEDDYHYHGYYYDYSDDAEISVVPVTATLKWIIIPGRIEPYVEAGVGVYFVDADVSFYDGHYSEDDTTFGWHIGFGMNFNIAPAMFLGFEFRYLWASPELAGTDVDIDGITTTFNVGFRF